MTSERWSIQVNDHGKVRMLFGPPPRKTVDMPTQEARALAKAILATVELAEGLAVPDGQ